MKKILFTVMSAAISFLAVSQETIPLYEGAIPNSKPSQLQDFTFHAS